MSKKEYFETLKLEQGGIVLLGENKACKVHGIGMIKLKMFDDHEFLLHNMRYVPDLRQFFLSISIFNNLSYCIRVCRVIFMKVPNSGDAGVLA